MSACIPCAWAAVLALAAATASAVAQSGEGGIEAGGEVSSEGDGTVPLLPLLPPLWKTGETHAHLQLCGEPSTLTPEELLAEQVLHERQVTCAQLWGIHETIPSFLETWAPLVTGSEHPVSLGDPDYVVQLGVEVSMFPAQQFGHVQCIGLSHALLSYESSYPGPILLECRAQPGALTGYAHVLWPTGYGPPRLDPYYGGTGYLAPTDVALGLADFVEAVFQRADVPQYDWRGMYYKLLNAGLRPSLTSGRDPTCALAPFDERMAARIADEPLSFEKWTAAIRAGRTTVAEGRKFIDLSVDGAAIGDSLYLDGPGQVTAEARLTVAQAHAGVLRIVHDGLVAPGGQPYSLTAGETVSVRFSVAIDQSGWLAAEAKGDDDSDAHTGAIYVLVAGQPIARALDAGYCGDAATALIANLGAFAFASPAERDAAAEHIAAGRAVFDALEAGALPPSPGVVRYGLSSPACEGPIQIGVRGLPPSGSLELTITTLHAPALAEGWLIVGTQPALAPALVGGARIHIDLTAPHTLVPVLASLGGYHEYAGPLSTPLSNQPLYWQSIWRRTADCPTLSGGLLAASDAIGITLR
jgi:hypothetical protein